ncbi:MAG: site-specific DNA-methyltransferase [Bacteroidales bacterium]|nr:site-specific DNA-methyltransferase [Bacteroidales bacterium]
MIRTKIQIKKLSEIPIEYDWSFSDKTIKDTAYITHGYYTYPAKFIPQLVSRIIRQNSQDGDIIIDPFMGSGTTVIEAIVNNRIGIGTDINEIAVLLAKVKSTPIEYKLLLNEFSNLILKLNSKLNGEFDNELLKANEHIKLPERVDYWFKPHIKNKLLVILFNILKIENKDIQDFFLITFSQILKSCSIWLQKSVKPTRDFNKKEIDPFYKFELQAKKMIKKHESFNNILSDEVKNNIGKFRIVKNSDARQIPCENEKATLIVTSPPYVTSYEYADLHQLPSLWFGFLDELSSFRKKFIGSSYRERKLIDLKSFIADKIVNELGNNKKGIEVRNYFADMLESFIEMKRVLKKGGRAAIVIGNTKLKGVEILNAEVFKEQFENIGFIVHKIIKREIPSKMLPSTRDPKTGKFTKANNSKNTLVYPTEYILIMEKI